MDCEGVRFLRFLESGSVRVVEVGREDEAAGRPKNSQGAARAKGDSFYIESQSVG